MSELAKPLRKWLRRFAALAALFGLLLLLVAFAPWIVAQTPLRSRLVADAIGPLNGSIHVGAASFGWLSGPELRDVELRDEAGQRVLFVPRIRLEKTLLALLRNRSDVGLIEIDDPEAMVTTTADSSNWERVLAPQLVAGGSSPALMVAVHRGKATLRDDTGGEWAVKSDSIRVTQVNDPSAPIALSGTADVEGATPGRIEFDGEIGSAVKAKLKAEQLPLALLHPVLARLGLSAKLDGRLSGRLNVDLASASGSPTMLDGMLTIGGLRGEQAGRAVAVDSVVSLDFAVRGMPSAVPQIDRLKCSADFLKIEASSTPDSLTLAADLDLNLLEKRLGQFIDFGDTHPAGHGTFRLMLTRDPAGNLKLSGTGGLADFVLSLPGPRVVQEKDIQLRFEAVAAPQGTSYRVANAGVYLNSGGEGIDLTLLEPLDLQKLGSASVRLALRGQLSRYRGWLAPFAGLPAQWQLGGAADASARLRFSPQAVELLDAQAVLRDFRFVGAGLNIAEPTVTLQPAAATWNRDASRLELRHAELACPTAAATLTQLKLEPTKTGSVLAANGAMRGDLSRLSRWMPTVAPDGLRGTFSGPLDVRMQGGAISGGLDFTFVNAMLGDPASPTWTEPAVRIAARGRYDAAQDGVDLETAELHTPAIGLTSAGRLTHLAGECGLNLSGEFTYDLEKLESRLRPFLGADAKVAGRGRRPFHVEGSLAKAAGSTSGPLGRLKAEAAIGWDGIQAYGFAVGPADVQVRMLGDGWLRVQPIETTLNQGKLKLEPYVRLEPGPMELVLGKGTAIDHAKINEAACARSLGYAAPAFAGVHDAQGELSVAIDGGRVPLADPGNADISGKIILHSAHATPGPLVRELNALQHKPADLKLAKELTVPVRLAKGRVYHSNLELPLGDFTVKTSGSVGLDGTLALVAEMPVPPKWLPKGVPALAKQPLKLPIGGTLAKPQLDEKAMQQEMARLAVGAGEDAVKKELEKNLRNLFQPKK
ncbi:MAG: hypothetical protein ACJ8F7_18265 [Gemmataceae bacterium]